MHIRRNTLAACIDATAAACSLPAALYLRLGSGFIGYAEHYLHWGIAAFVLLFTGFSLSFRFNRGAWRYISMREMFALVKVATIAVAAFYLLMFLALRLEGVPRSVPFIHWLVLTAFLAAPRIAYRAFRERSFGLVPQARPAVPVLLVGYRHRAEQFVRELQRTPRPLYRVVGIVDDNPSYRGRSLHGIHVYGGIGDIPAILRKLARRQEKPQRMILSDESLEGETAARLLALCDEHGLTLARLPRLTDFKPGQEGPLAVRAVAIEDILGRSQTVHDKSGMRALVEGKAVLVTGAGGTIGGELARQVAALNPERLILLDASEYNLYRIDLDLAETAPGILRETLLADVRNRDHLDSIFKQFKPKIVFHAAAIKHVPLAEINVEEAVLTNVFGTVNVAAAAHQGGAAAMVTISTDKAVNPTNVMGATKRLAEHYVCRLASEETRYVTVRFGNVLGSTGSVVPLFQRQLEAGGPLTVTHRDMTRYFMTVREAVELVIQSAVLGQQAEAGSGQLYVLEMGQPVKIRDLAEQMIRLAGFRPHQDIKITYTGLRPGEKLHEELFYPAEALARTAQAGIMRAQIAPGDAAMLEAGLAQLRQACEKRDVATVLRLLEQLVPEYRKLRNAAA